MCKLEPAHVLSLRLYSTAVYKSINVPLRDTLTLTVTQTLALALALTLALYPYPYPYPYH